MAPDLADRGRELQTLGRLVNRLEAAGREEEGSFVGYMLTASTYDAPVPAAHIQRLRALVDEAEGVM